MKRTSLATGLLALVAGCVNPEITQERTPALTQEITFTTTPDNRTMRLFSREKLILEFQDSFNKSYGLATQSFGGYTRNKDRDDLMDRAIAQRFLIETAFHVVAMRRYIQELQVLKVNTNYLEQRSLEFLK